MLLLRFIQIHLLELLPHRTVSLLLIFGPCLTTSTYGRFLGQLVRSKLHHRPIIEINIQNDSFTSISFFRFDQSFLIEHLDELLGILPAGFLELKCRRVRSSRSRQIWRDEFGDNRGRSKREVESMMRLVGMSTFALVQTVQKSLSEDIINFCT